MRGVDINNISGSIREVECRVAFDDRTKRPWFADFVVSSPASVCITAGKKKR